MNDLNSKQKKEMCSLIFSNNSEENFTQYLKATNKNSNEALKDFNFDLINSLIFKYVEILRSSGLKEDCFFSEFKSPFHLVTFKKPLYFHHFYNKNSTLLQKLKVKSLYSKMKIKFVSFKNDNNVIPMIMVSLSYIPTKEAFFLVPLNSSSKQIFSIKRNSYDKFTSFSIEDFEQYLITDINKLFYLHSSKVIKQYNIKRKDFIKYSFEESKKYLNISLMVDY